MSSASNIVTKIRSKRNQWEGKWYNRAFDLIGWFTFYRPFFQKYPFNVKGMPYWIVLLNFVWFTTADENKVWFDIGDEELFFRLIWSHWFQWWSSILSRKSNILNKKYLRRQKCSIYFELKRRFKAIPYFQVSNFSIRTMKRYEKINGNRK